MIGRTDDWMDGLLDGRMIGRTNDRTGGQKDQPADRDAMTHVKQIGHLIYSVSNQ